MTRSVARGSELMEDSNSAVERRATQVVRALERLLGADDALRQFF